MKVKPFTRFTSLGPVLTVAQRACYRVAFDGVEPSELEGEERARALDIFGPIDTIPPAARRVFVQAKGRGIGGTRLAAERTVHIASTLQCPHVGRDELIHCFLGGPKLRHGRVGLRFARAEAQRQGLKFIDDTSDYFTILRYDGRKFRFEAFAASRGGDNVRGVHVAAAVLTEAAFYYDESGATNGAEIFAAIIPRLLKGGQVIIESTVWAEGTGLLWKEFTDNFGNPTRALAALCPTPLMRDDAETRAMVAAERERDPENASREFDAEFMVAGSGLFFDAAAVNDALDDSLSPVRRVA